MSDEKTAAAPAVIETKKPQGWVDVTLAKFDAAKLEELRAKDETAASFVEEFQARRASKARSMTASDLNDLHAAAAAVGIKIDKGTVGEKS